MQNAKWPWTMRWLTTLTHKKIYRKNSMIATFCLSSYQKLPGQFLVRCSAFFGLVSLTLIGLQGLLSSPSKVAFHRLWKKESNKFFSYVKRPWTAEEIRVIYLTTWHRTYARTHSKDNINSFLLLLALLNFAVVALNGKSRKEFIGTAMPIRLFRRTDVTAHVICHFCFFSPIDAKWPFFTWEQDSRCLKGKVIIKAKSNTFVARGNVPDLT